MLMGIRPYERPGRATPHSCDCSLCHAVAPVLQKVGGVKNLCSAGQWKALRIGGLRLQRRIAHRASFMFAWRARCRCSKDCGRKRMGNKFLTASCSCSEKKPSTPLLSDLRAPLCQVSECKRRGRSARETPPTKKQIIPNTGDKRQDDATNRSLVATHGSRVPGGRVRKQHTAQYGKPSNIAILPALWHLRAVQQFRFTANLSVQAPPWPQARAETLPTMPLAKPTHLQPQGPPVATPMMMKAPACSHKRDADDHEDATAQFRGA